MRSFALFSLLAGSALAHLQMQDPYPIKSPLNPAVGYADKDYSYTTPLVANGLPYPCKGYLDADPSLRTVQKTWPAGSTQSFTIAPPGAIHGGGSCQLSLSYDMGKTWNVIFSYIGGCMAEDLTNSFTIPSAAPSGNAVFSWSWFNKQGNREMYQNCAIVTITDGGSGLNSRDHPAPFVANAGDVNTCSTIEGNDPVFPNPGAVVKYSGSYKGTTPQSGLGISGTNCAHPGGADGAGTQAGTGGAQASPAPVSSSAAATASSAAASSSSQTPAVTPSANAVRPGSASIASSTADAASSSSASSTSTSVAPAATTTKARTCKRRRSKKSLVPQAVQVQGHRERRVRRQVGWGSRRMDLQTRAGTGRVAALPASRPVYTDAA